MTSLLGRDDQSLWSARRDARAHRTKQWLKPVPDPNRWIRTLSRADEPVRPRSKLHGAFQEIQQLRSLSADWDDEGASAIDAQTAEVAVSLLTAAEDRMIERYGRTIPPPTVSPCGDGSIDLFWKNDAYRLLINIQPPAVRESDFYGETRSGLKFRGTFPAQAYEAHIIPLLLDLMRAS